MRLDELDEANTIDQYEHQYAASRPLESSLFRRPGLPRNGIHYGVAIIRICSILLA